MTLLLVGGGAILAVGLCCICGGAGGYFFVFASPIVGTWEATNNVGPNTERSYHFGYFGSGTIKEKQQDGPDKGSYIETTVHFNYKIIQGDPMKLEIRPTRSEFRHSIPERQRQMEELGKQMAKQLDLDKIGRELKNVDFKIVYEARIDGDTLTLVMPDMPQFKQTFRRAR